jgi:predicted AAA+ superfamily ATPase
LPQELQGPALEGLVYQHLQAWIDYSGNSMRLYFWRTKAGNEVDFILYGEQGFFALEVKNSSIIHSKDLHGLKAFTEDYPEATPVLLYRGKDNLKQNGILCMPVHEFLINLFPKKPLPVQSRLL